MKKIIFVLLASLSLTAQNKIENRVLIPYRDNNLWGLSDTLGKVIIKPFAKEIKQFVISDDGKFTSRYVVRTNKAYYVIDRNKKALLPEGNTYDSITLNRFHPDHFFVYKKGKRGLFTNGKELIPCLYDNIEFSANESFEVSKEGLAGLINSQGKLIIPIEYTYIRRSWDSEDEKKTKFVWDAKGMLVEKKFYDIKLPEKHIEVVIVEEIIGDIPIKSIGDEIIDVEESHEESEEEKSVRRLKTTYDKVILDSRNTVIVQKNDKQGAYDLEQKKEVLDLVYDEAVLYEIDRGKKVFRVKLNNQYGLITEGNVAKVNIEYDKIRYDSVKRLNILIKGDKQGLIIFNTIYPIIPAKYVDIHSAEPIRINNHWQFGLFEVTTEKGTGLVGENGVEFFKD